MIILSFCFQRGGGGGGGWSHVSRLMNDVIIFSLSLNLSPPLILQLFIDRE